MTYQEFKQNIIDTISGSLKSDFKVTLQDIIKNNDIHLDGLTILSKQSNISPTIYLNYYYEQYLSGKSITEICDEILCSYQKNTPKHPIDISFFTDFEKVKKHLVFKLVNFKQNQELLSNIPHIRYLDLAILCNCLLKTPDNGYATILIHQQHLSFWNISQKELFQIAMQNTPKLLPYQLLNMADILKHLFYSENSDLPDANFSPIPMYILSNSSKLNGAGCILYENVLANISAKLNSDLCIIPSSIHEVLLIPVDYAESSKEMASMVKEVNDTQLSRDEILSDHVYHYSRCTGEITSF